MSADETRFADRLNLALKALMIGRGRLATEIGVDKSMVSRWLAGTARPSAYNIEKVTRLIAGLSPGFSLLDWESDLELFRRRLGIEAADEGPDKPSTSAGWGDRECHPGRLPFGSLESAAIETERRAGAYCGRWKSTRLRSTGALQPVVEYALIRPDGAGLCMELLLRSHRLKGWLIVAGGIAYAFLSDSNHDSFGYYCLNGALGPTALVLDGILCSVGGHRTSTPFAEVVVMERVGDLEGHVADEAWALEAMSLWGDVPLDSLDPELVAALTRDFGRSAAMAGGEAILRVPAERSLARGGFQS